MNQEPIECRLCGGKVHSIQLHLDKDHPGFTIENYKTSYPDAPLLSDYMQNLLQERLRQRQAETQSAVPETAPEPETAKVELTTGTAAEVAVLTKQPFHEVFNLPADKMTLSARGKPTPIAVFAPHSMQHMVPKINEDYVFDAEQLKDAVLGYELNMPVYVWGHKGAGKTELHEQICARTNRPMLRVQHTVNTEESQIVGQMTARGGETFFEMGPLPMAMLNGWVYLADEYDFALPSVLSVYQAILEGKPLVLKEGHAGNRIIEPHPNFRIVGTGNTNGSGDENGLYQGTQIQNSANYDRWGVTIHKKYMNEASEIKILVGRAKVREEEAKQLVKFATEVRQAFDGGKISDIISPRALVNSARLGIMKASFSKGIALAFSNKLSSVDRKVVDEYAGRIFGK